jgi:hypothetical protein
MSDEYDDEDLPIRLDFSGVGPRKAFHLLPAGRYIAEVVDFTKDKASDEATNPGAQIIKWEFTIESTVDGETEIETRVKNPETKRMEDATIKVEGRTLFDSMVIVENSLWRLMSLLDACWFDTKGEINLRPEEVLSNRLILQIGIQAAKKDRKTRKEYRARNKIVEFFPLEEERPMSDEPAPEATEEEPAGADV